MEINPERICSILSIARAAAFYMVNKLIKNKEPEAPTKPPKNQPAFNVLKMKSPDVNPFSGNPLDWRAWQVATQATLTSTGFEEVLEHNFDPKASSMNKKKNQVVYAILCKACERGNASYHVLKHSKTLDRSKAWNSLRVSYDSDEMAITMSNILRNKIRGTQLVPGIDAASFVNDFMVTFERLKEMEEHKMHETEAKSLFLNAIIDPEYKVRWIFL